MADDKNRKAPTEAMPSDGGGPPWFWIVLVAVIAIVAVVVIKAGSDDKGKAVKGAVETAKVRISGDSLTPQPKDPSAKDPSVGKVVPDLRGKTLKGDSIAISNDGRPKAYIFLAHWCPHCQAEVPRLVGHWDKVGMPKDVDVYTVATSTNERENNYPPSTWLKDEKWPTEVLADDENSSALDAFGGSSFPYMVFVGADGTVVKRVSGEIEMSEFDSYIKQAAAKK